jgi:hypothetical protein
MNNLPTTLSPSSTIGTSTSQNVAFSIDTQAPSQSLHITDMFQQSINQQEPTSLLIEQFLANTAGNFPSNINNQQFLPIQQPQSQVPITTTAESLISDENLRLLATLAALRVEQQNKRDLLAHLEASTSMDVATTIPQLSGLSIIITVSN